jgi:hypothetical protein
MSDLDALKCAIRDVLDERTKMPSEEHRSHHEWVALQIERQQARAEFWRAMLAKSLPAMTVSLLLALAGWAYNWAINHLTWR